MNSEKQKKLSRKEVRKQLDDIILLFHKTPKAKKTKESLKKIKSETKNLNSLQEIIDYLRVCTKYTLLDLEATRRENDYLKKLLKESR